MRSAVIPRRRWTLRRAVTAVNAVLESLRLEKHPDKTFIGKIERGFDFLGYHFSREGLRVAKATIQKFVERATRLYEQERERLTGHSALGMYVRRWNSWASGGLERTDRSRRSKRRNPGKPMTICGADAVTPA